MRGYYEVMRDKAWQEGGLHLRFTVDVIVDEDKVKLVGADRDRQLIDPTGYRSVEEVIADEIQSNLDSLDYTIEATVRRKY